jgi:hypothetical protein
VKRHPQPGYYCPGCERELPHGLSWGLMGEMERTKTPVLYEAPCCKVVHNRILIKWERKR